MPLTVSGHSCQHCMLPSLVLPLISSRFASCAHSHVGSYTLQVTSTLQVSGSAGKLSVLALALLPLLAEAIALGLCLGLWLKLHVFMAIAGAIILATVCPAVTGATMHEWQRCRLGTRSGAVLSPSHSWLLPRLLCWVLEHMAVMCASLGRSIDCIACISSSTSPTLAQLVSIVHGVSL